VLKLIRNTDCASLIVSQKIGSLNGCYIGIIPEKPRLIYAQHPMDKYIWYKLIKKAPRVPECFTLSF
jgi:hypothetical protein